VGRAGDRRAADAGDSALRIQRRRRRGTTPAGARNRSSDLRRIGCVGRRPPRSWSLGDAINL